MRLFCSKCQKVFEAEKAADSTKVKCPVCGDEQDFPQTVPGPGVVVGDFLIEKMLSRGGMGEVFLAKQISLDRPVALKVLQQKHIEDREYVDSLFKEARAAAKLSHPNIVQAYAIGEDDGICPHALHVIGRDPPSVPVDFFDPSFPRHSAVTCFNEYENRGRDRDLNTSQGIHNPLG